MTLFEAATESQLSDASVWEDAARLHPDERLDYFTLAGYDAQDALTDDEHAFDRHVLTSILAVSDLAGAATLERAGLDAEDLQALLRQWFPRSAALVAAWASPPAIAVDEEIEMVRDLLLANRSTSGDTGRWLAAMIARRAMEPNHLWEDLGFRERSELTRMLMRHFAPLAQRNTRNMRWKRFFYRMLCEEDGFVMCSTPVCTQCKDFDLCFGEESGESRMAERRRELELRAAADSA